MSEFINKHYVVFFSPGTFVSEQTEKEIDTPDIRVAVEMAKSITERYGAKPYGFQFVLRKTHPPLDDGEGGKLEVLAKEIRRSGTYFIGGKLLLLSDLERSNDQNDRFLIDNMRINDYPIVIENTNSWKSTMPFREEDVLLTADGEIQVLGDNPQLKDYRLETILRIKRERGF